MTHRRRKPKPITDRLVRVYEIQLWPDGPTPGEPTVDGPYDPEVISLGYASDEVPGDPLSDEVKREALKRALKTNGYSGEELERAMDTHRVHNLRFKFPKFIKAEDTKEYQVAHGGSR